MSVPTVRLERVGVQHEFRLYLEAQVERETVLYEYRLGADGRYGEPAMHTDEFRTETPFPLVIRVPELKWRG